jgi:hypothetical protein
MTCRSCGATIAEKAVVCYRCGAPTAEPGPTRPPAPPAGIGRIRWLVSATMAVVLGGVALALPETSSANRPAEAGFAAAAILAAWHWFKRRR